MRLIYNFLRSLSTKTSLTPGVVVVFLFCFAAPAWAWNLTGTIYEPDRTTAETTVATVNCAIVGLESTSSSTDGSGNYTCVFSSSGNSGDILQIYGTIDSQDFNAITTVDGMGNDAILHGYETWFLPSTGNSNLCIAADFRLFTCAGINLTVTGAGIFLNNSWTPGANVTTPVIIAGNNYAGVAETLTITGSGTGGSMPLQALGTVPSTVVFQGSSNTTIPSLVYDTLVLQPSAASPTYTLTSATVNTAFTIDNSNVLTVAATGALTVPKMVIGSNITYSGSTETLVLTGSGTGASRPLYINGGTFIAPSMVRFTGTSSSDIEAVDYVNVEFKPTSGSPTYTLGSAAMDLTGSITIGTGANAVTVTGATNNPAMMVDGWIKINTSATFVAPSSLSLKGKWFNNGTFTHNSGTVTFNGVPGSSSWITSHDSLGAQGLTIVHDTLQDVLYVGTDSLGVNRCPLVTGCEQDSDWIAMAITGDSHVMGMTIDTINNVIYAMTYPNGLFYRCDIVATNCDTAGDWTQVYDSAASTTQDMAFDAANGVVYASADVGIFRCNTATLCDAGGDWTSSNSTGHTALAIDTTNNVLYAGRSDGIFRCALSTGCDANGDWTTAYNTGNYVYHMAFDAADGIMYVGAEGGVIYRCDITTSGSCDDSSDWTTVFDSSDSAISTLVYDSQNGIMYAGSRFTPHIYACDTSTNCDATGDWLISYTPVLTSAASVVYDMIAVNGVVYAVATDAFSVGKIYRYGEAHQAINDSNTWFGLAITGTVARIAFLESGVTQTIANNGSLTLTGASGNLLTLVPTVAASAWNLTLGTGVTQSISYASVSYSNAVGGVRINASNGTNTNGGNNTNWCFSGCATKGAMMQFFF